MSFSSQAKARTSNVATSERKPFWDLYEDGITFTLLGKWLMCRERFRIFAVEGIREKQSFSKDMEFGNLLHEAFDVYGKTSSVDEGKKAIEKYKKSIHQQYPEAPRDEIEMWTYIASGMFEIYTDYFHKQDEKKRPLSYEQSFRVPVTLPSGRTINLRGKFDGSYAEPISRNIAKIHGYHYDEDRKMMEIALMENKAKGTIYHGAIEAGLPMELQTMLYLTCLLFSDLKIDPEYTGNGCNTYREMFGVTGTLGEYPETDAFRPPSVLYNVVQRPLSRNAKFNLSQRKGRKKDKSGAETRFQYFDRILYDDVQGVKGNPDYFFHRWYFRPSWEDLIRIQRRSIIPMLEQLCDWWDSIKDDPFNPWETENKSVTSSKRVCKSNCKDCKGSGKAKDFPGALCNCVSFPPNKILNKHHYQRPFGIYDSMASGWEGDYFDYLTSGNVSNLERCETLFPELDEDV